jgi:hypothetical protein
MPLRVKERVFVLISNGLRRGKYLNEWRLSPPIRMGEDLKRP